MRPPPRVHAVLRSALSVLSLHEDKQCDVPRRLQLLEVMVRGPDQNVVKEKVLTLWVKMCVDGVENPPVMPVAHIDHIDNRTWPGICRTLMLTGDPTVHFAFMQEQSRRDAVAARQQSQQELPQPQQPTTPGEQDQRSSPDSDEDDAGEVNDGQIGLELQDFGEKHADSSDEEKQGNPTG